MPALVKLFSSTDRATRINLLQQLETFHDFLTADVVTKEIFPQIVNGFTDTVPQMREQVGVMIANASLSPLLLFDSCRCCFGTIFSFFCFLSFLSYYLSVFSGTL